MALLQMCENWDKEDSLLKYLQVYQNTCSAWAEFRIELMQD
jgi:hypothetical protein